MPDRFLPVDNPAKVIGYCPVCHDEIQKGYEKHCSYCSETICEDCQRICWICETKGCKWCMTKKDSNGEYICEICMSNRQYLISEAMAGVNILNYYHSATSETDEETVLEYASNEYPKVRLCIAKVRE